MPAYQNYYPGLYNSQYQQMQNVNPYMYPNLNNQQYGFMQSQQVQGTQLNQQGIVGRVVTNFDEIVANDVPMDGRSAVFPKNDMTEIQVKSWGADGKIQTVTYKPILDGLKTDGTNNSINSENIKFELSDAVRNEFMKRFDELSERLEDMEKSISKSAVKTRKREADSDE